MKPAYIAMLMVFSGAGVLSGQDLDPMAEAISASVRHPFFAQKLEGREVFVAEDSATTRQLGAVGREIPSLTARRLSQDRGVTVPVIRCRDVSLRGCEVAPNAAVVQSRVPRIRGDRAEVVIALLTPEVLPNGTRVDWKQEYLFMLRMNGGKWEVVDIIYEAH